MRALAITLATAAALGFAGLGQLDYAKAQSQSGGGGRQTGASQSGSQGGREPGPRLGRAWVGRRDARFGRRRAVGRATLREQRKSAAATNVSVGGRSDRGTTVRTRSRTTIGVRDGGSDDVVIKRKRRHVVAVYDGEPAPP